MSEHQYRRLNQLTDLLIFNEITNDEYIEYQYLCELLAVQYEAKDGLHRMPKGR